MVVCFGLTTTDVIDIFGRLGTKDSLLWISSTDVSLAASFVVFVAARLLCLSTASMDLTHCVLTGVGCVRGRSTVCSIAWSMVTASLLAAFCFLCTYIEKMTMGNVTKRKTPPMTPAMTPACAPVDKPPEMGTVLMVAVGILSTDDMNAARIESQVVSICVLCGTKLSILERTRQYEYIAKMLL